MHKFKSMHVTDRATDILHYLTLSDRYFRHDYH